MILLDLFLGFLRVGCFAFGGAYGAIPLIRDVVLSYGWLDEEALSYMIAVSESTPGPIMINLATYVGSTQAGLPGSAVATAAVVLPSFVVILLITALLTRFLQNNIVQAILRGVKPCVIGIVLATGIHWTFTNLFAQSGLEIDITAGVLSLILSVILFGPRFRGKKKISPIALILISGVLGIVLFP